MTANGSVPGPIQLLTAGAVLSRRSDSLARSASLGCQQPVSQYCCLQHVGDAAVHGVGDPAGTGTDPGVDTEVTGVSTGLHTVHGVGDPAGVGTDPAWCGHCGNWCVYWSTYCSWCW
ncbi:hypothetical protein BaRGS_00037792 [Batillaria attramentaria]|uniref:Uncharacterized protein n=1 Tax=Batillaria attramentaria TaxID=370345 RepID=A0ABD0J7W5_9CAEN